MTEPRVYFRHARMITRPGGRMLCKDGIEAWCARHEIDVTEFIELGVPGERFVEIGDAYGLKALEFARTEVAGGIE